MICIVFLLHFQIFLAFPGNFLARSGIFGPETAGIVKIPLHALLLPEIPLFFPHSPCGLPLSSFHSFSLSLPIINHLKSDDYALPPQFVHPPTGSILRLGAINIWCPQNILSSLLLPFCHSHAKATYHYFCVLLGHSPFCVDVMCEGPVALRNSAHCSWQQTLVQFVDRRGCKLLNMNVQSLYEVLKAL